LTVWWTDDDVASHALMIDTLRTALHRTIATPVGDRFFWIRVPKDIARRANAMLGEPLCTRAELSRRRAGRARLEELKGENGASRTGSQHGREHPIQAPVVVYFENDRNVRMLARIRETLESKAIPYALLDIANDEVTKEFVLREAMRTLDDLPIVFVGSAAVGSYQDLVDWNVSGRLARALEGG